MNSNSQGRIIAGLILLIFGVLALLDNLDLFALGRVLHFWPIVFIVIGAVKLSQAQESGGYLVGGGFVLAGLLMTLNSLGLIHFRMHDWWPLFLIGAGILVLVRGQKSTLGVDKRDEANTDSHIMAILGGTQIRNTSSAYQGGELTAVMGGIEIDLRQAGLLQEARLNVFAMWGGISLKVPADWEIDVRVTPILGGANDETLHVKGTGKRLVITGYAIMGGIDISN